MCNYNTYLTTVFVHTYVPPVMHSYDYTWMLACNSNLCAILHIADGHEHKVMWCRILLFWVVVATSACL